jgi:L-idonate 5-dehydrogenase
MALAAVIHAPKDLRIEDRPVREPGPSEVEIRIGVGGICGSDLHYYNHGGFGTVRLREPMILGHEIAGTISKVGTDVAHLEPGQHVAVNPSRPCQTCEYCQRGMHNHCTHMRFYGSAMRFPHIQGAFSEKLVCDAVQAIPIPDTLSLAEAAFAEPLAVCLHAVRRAGELLGKRVLITGSGPIGALTAMAARCAGAGEIIVTDIVDHTLFIAQQCGGVDQTINSAKTPDLLAPLEAGKGSIDVMFECSGNNHAFVGALAAMRPRGIIVQIGLGGEFAFLMNVLVAKEIDLRGTFRFHDEFYTAVSLITSNRINVRPLLTQTVPLADAVAGFELANDRNRAMKVQIRFD